MKYYLCDNIKKNEMGGLRSMHGGEEKHKCSWWANLREGTNLEDAGVDGNR